MLFAVIVRYCLSQMKRSQFVLDFLYTMFSKSFKRGLEQMMQQNFLRYFTNSMRCVSTSIVGYSLMKHVKHSSFSRILNYAHAYLENNGDIKNNKI